METKAICPKEIAARLSAFASEAGVRILYACESGSRAWGFPSEDSDYDVRFLYVYPRAEYFSIDSPPDVLNHLDGDWDFAGWELGKALRLMRKSNMVIREYLVSPIVYVDNPILIDELREAQAWSFRPKAGVYHYLSMARKAAEDLRNSKEIKAKKLLYALRCTLAAQWIVQYGTMPPIEMAPLAEAALAPEMKGWLQELIASKAEAGERFEVSVPATVKGWMERAWAQVSEATFAPESEEKDVNRNYSEIYQRAIGV